MNNSFKDRFKGLRKRDNYTQDELAEKLGISRSGVSAYELGAREPDFETLEMIADFFNVDVAYLLGESDIRRQRVITNDNYAAEDIYNKLILTKNKSLIELLGKLSNLSVDEIEALNKLIK